MAWPKYKPPSGIPSGGPASGIPAKGAGVVQQPGNFTSLRHGATSPRLWRPVADELASELVVMRPDLAQDFFLPEVRAWARVEAQLLIIADWSERVGLLDAEGEPRKFVSVLMKLEGSARKHRDALGLSPVSFVRLQRDRAEIRNIEVSTDATMQSLQARGREVLQARREELGIVPPPLPEREAE